MKYEYKKGKFIKNGHTMFEQDVLQDLKRLDFLEKERTEQLRLSEVIRQSEQLVCASCGVDPKIDKEIICSNCLPDFIEK